VKEELHPRTIIQRNAKRVAELHARIHETFKNRSNSKEAWQEWERACADFHRQYDSLAFPGGYEQGVKRLQAGDSHAIENAIAFVEVRPYFFHSQYMRTKLIRLLKRSKLSARQLDRFQKVLLPETQPAQKLSKSK
jgi:hypothetical protein